MVLNAWTQIPSSVANIYFAIIEIVKFRREEDSHPKRWWRERTQKSRCKARGRARLCAAGPQRLWPSRLRTSCPRIHLILGPHSPTLLITARASCKIVCDSWGAKPSLIFLTHLLHIQEPNSSLWWKPQTRRRTRSCRCMQIPPWALARQIQHSTVLQSKTRSDTSASESLSFSVANIHWLHRKTTLLFYSQIGHWSCRR